MLNHEVLDDLRTRLIGGDTLLFLQTHEETRWEQRLHSLANELDRQWITWSPTTGEGGTGNHRDLGEFLSTCGEREDGTVFLVKDAHFRLQDSIVVRQFRDLAESMKSKSQTILILGPSDEIPFELKKQSHLTRLPLPGLPELMSELGHVLAELKQKGFPFEISQEEQERLSKTVLGLTADEARRAFRFSLMNVGEINDDLYARLISEKRQMVQGSDLLEFYDLEEGAAEIGGLEGLKDWLNQRASAFSTAAQEQGIPAPKGVFLLGVQGCGKSLTARVTASLLRFPLIRLDTAALLASDRGASERNLREVLKLVETIAPAVLWIDEIDKGFGGFDSEAGGDATMSRIVGAFLTWMEEHKSQVFVVATANSVQRLPPELLRRGRFDELFFVDLPNYQERKMIFAVHLAKRGWNPEKFDLELLSNDSEGFSGAEIEQIVASAMLESYAHDRILSEQDMIAEREQTVPLSTTKEDEIFELREWARTRCRPATPDSRVAQMLESEEREGLLEVEGPTEEIRNRWKALADLGQLNAAMLEYIRPRTAVTIQEIQNDWSDFVETRGDLGLALRVAPNAVLYSGLSREICDLLIDLVKKKRIYLHPGSVNQFDTDAFDFSLPACEELGAEPPSRPMWVPMTFQVSPAADADERHERIARVMLNQPKAQTIKVSKASNSPSLGNPVEG